MPQRGRPVRTRTGQAVGDRARAARWPRAAPAAARGCWPFSAAGSCSRAACSGSLAAPRAAGLGEVAPSGPGCPRPPAAPLPVSVPLPVPVRAGGSSVTTFPRTDSPPPGAGFKPREVEPLAAPGPSSPDTPPPSPAPAPVPAALSGPRGPRGAPGAGARRVPPGRVPSVPGSSAGGRSPRDVPAGTRCRGRGLRRAPLCPGRVAPPPRSPRPRSPRPRPAPSRGGGGQRMAPPLCQVRSESCPVRGAQGGRALPGPGVLPGPCSADATAPRASDRKCKRGLSWHGQAEELVLFELVGCTGAMQAPLVLYQTP